MLQKFIHRLDKLFNLIGGLCALLLILTTINIIFDVIMRYVFNDVSIGLQEMEWHLFSTMFLLGISYALKNDTHVRVDFLYEKFSVGSKSLVNIFGVLFLVIPVSALIVKYGIDFAYDAFESSERSGDPGGLTHRWIIKSIIPLSFLLTIIAALHMFFQNLNIALNIYGSEKIKSRLCFPLEQKENNL